jgi:hypothetical protein
MKAAQRLPRRFAESTTLSPLTLLARPAEWKFVGNRKR